MHNSTHGQLYRKKSSAISHNVKLPKYKQTCQKNEHISAHHCANMNVFMTYTVGFTFGELSCHLSLYIVHDVKRCTLPFVFSGMGTNDLLMHVGWQAPQMWLCDDGKLTEVEVDFSFSWRVSFTDLIRGSLVMICLMGTYWTVKFGQLILLAKKTLIIGLDS